MLPLENLLSANEKPRDPLQNHNLSGLIYAPTGDEHRRVTLRSRINDRTANRSERGSGWQADPNQGSAVSNWT